MKIKLFQLDKLLKRFLTLYLIMLVVGVSVGIIYLAQTTSLTPKGTVERFQGSEKSGADGFEIPEQYPKPISEMLITTHNHILGLGLVFLTLGLIFYFSTIVKGSLKTFLLIEPLISVLLTFGSLWLVRFVDKSFIYLTFFSSVMMYLSFYTVAGIILYELNFKKDDYLI